MPGSAVADIRETYGAAFIGLLFSTVLYGMTITQTWIYYCHYRNRDPVSLKGFIALLFILDTLHTILCFYSVYWYLVLNFGNVVNLDFNMWAINIQADVNALTGYLVQLFYARRLYIMSKSIIVPVIIGVLGGICFALGFVFTERTFALQQYSRYSSLTWVTCVGMGSTALADILIALAMCWCLYHKRTGFAKTDSIIMTLISYSVNSGLLTSILAIGMLVSFVALPTRLIWEQFFWLMGKCYVNSFLAMLNSRDSLRERSSDNNSVGLRISSVQQDRTCHISRTGPTPVTVKVHRTTTTDFAESEHDDELDKRGGLADSVHDGFPESPV